ncbi:hypothetical protein BDP67DRAFT_75530 [Colletotrichum lupini]|nr:hypothetical protein BDP67DRAFT_75530 [Colletotrichum lupini]
MDLGRRGRGELSFLIHGGMSGGYQVGLSLKAPGGWTRNAGRHGKEREENRRKYGGREGGDG